MRTKTLSLLDLEWEHSYNHYMKRDVYTTKDPRFKDLYPANTVFENNKNGPVFFYINNIYSIIYVPLTPELEYIHKMLNYKWYENE